MLKKRNKKQYIICVDVRGTEISAVLMNEKGKVFKKIKALYFLNPIIKISLDEKLKAQGISRNY